MAKLFEYAVLYHPKTKKVDGEEKREKSKVLVDVKRVLAADDKEVAILAAREIPEEYLDQLETVEIVVRPF
jgi:hypothetical protein